jgi:hypothetical protein
VNRQALTQPEKLLRTQMKEEIKMPTRKIQGPKIVSPEESGSMVRISPENSAPRHDIKH